MSTRPKVLDEEQPVSVETVNDAFRQAAQSERMQDILGFADGELVSANIVGETYSALVDGPSTMTFGDHLVKVLAWYDNEWRFARRVVDEDSTQRLLR